MNKPEKNMQGLQKENYQASCLDLKRAKKKMRYYVHELKPCIIDSFQYRSNHTFLKVGSTVPA